MGNARKVSITVFDLLFREELRQMFMLKIGYPSG